MAFDGGVGSCLSFEQLLLPEEEKTERFMRSLECAAQEKTEISLRGKGSKHIPKSDRKIGYPETEGIMWDSPQLTKPLR